MTCGGPDGGGRGRPAAASGGPGVRRERTLTMTKPSRWKISAARFANPGSEGSTRSASRSGIPASASSVCRSAATFPSRLRILPGRRKDGSAARAAVWQCPWASGAGAARNGGARAVGLPPGRRTATCRASRASRASRAAAPRRPWMAAGAAAEALHSLSTA